MTRMRRQSSPVRGALRCKRRPRVSLAKSAMRLLTAVACGIAASLLAVALPAQVRFEMPDPAIRLERYTTVDDCLAASGRVRDSVQGQAT
ncbi:MAG TPA: hypothetical protein VIR34_04735, partial [Gemmatimonadaceae bacterium]